jgi:hypothetical protein
MAKENVSDLACLILADADSNIVLKTSCKKVNIAVFEWSIYLC